MTLDVISSKGKGFYDVAAGWTIIVLHWSDGKVAKWTFINMKILQSIPLKTWSFLGHWVSFLCQYSPNHPCWSVCAEEEGVCFSSRCDHLTVTTLTDPTDRQTDCLQGGGGKDGWELRVDRGHEAKTEGDADRERLKGWNKSRRKQGQCWSNVHVLRL